MIHSPRSTSRRRLAELAALACLAAAAHALPAAEDEIIVHMTPGASVQPLVSQTGTTLLATIPGSSLHLLAAPAGASQEEVELLVEMLDASPQTRYAEPNGAIGVPGIEPCDIGPEVSVQQCTIGFVDGDATIARYLRQAWLKTLRIPRAQELSGDFPIIVAVIDTGVDPLHPALAHRLAGQGHDFILAAPGGWDLADGMDTDGNGLVDEAFGHGTHVAGTIALIAPSAQILPLRVADSDGNGTLFDVAHAIWFATDAGARIINLSLSTTYPSQAVADALHFAISLGIDVYTSAGNTGSHVLYPASLPGDADTFVPLPPIYPHGVIAVAAVDDLGQKASFSAWGPEVDVSAPGVAIYGPYPGNRYAWWSGTSMSCAVASGVAALAESCGQLSLGLPSGEALVKTAHSLWMLDPRHAGGLGSGLVDALDAALEFHVD